MKLYITRIEPVKKQWRINLSGLIKFPQEVILVLDPKKKDTIMIFTTEEKNFGEKHQIDERGRLIIPFWIRENLNIQVGQNILILSDGEHYYLKPEQPSNRRA